MNNITKIRAIVRVVATHYNIVPDDIYGPRRGRPHDDARRAIYYFARELTPLSSTQIGHLLHRDHSTVIHGHKRLIQKLKTCDETRTTIGTIIDAIGAEFARIYSADQRGGLDGLPITPIRPAPKRPLDGSPAGDN